MVRASLSLGHPTFAYIRPIHASSPLSKLHHLQSLGLTFFQGELDEQEKLVSCLQRVDVVVSTLAVPQYLKQLKLIKAIKQADNIKVTLSELGREGGMENIEKSKILIIGATGYLGDYMVRASLSLGHPTFAYIRPIHSSTQLSKLHNLQSLGLTFFQGELDEQEKLVSCLQQVDVVISTLAVPQHLEQLKLIKAIKQAGNIKRFVPSEYGNEADRVKGLPPFEALLENKRKIRRATEEAGIPYTYVSANSFASYFINYLLHPHDLKTQQHILVYGTGEAKAVLNYEEDVAFYTVKAATDERAENRVLIVRPQGNIISQLELITLWENRTKRAFERQHMPEDDMVKLCETLDFPENVPMAILHSIFVKGAQTMLELGPEDVEASQLYPDYKYTSVDALLDVFLDNPSHPRLAKFV